MHRILVPLDGSPFGETALLPAGDLAERTGSSLDLVTVRTPVHVRARSYLDRLAQELHRRFEVAVLTTVVEGSVPSAIVEHVREDPPDLIVMSTHARSGPGRLLSGSVADRLLHELHCPLILLRPGRASAAGQLPALPRVLVALDGSALAETVIDEVERFLPRDLTTLHLLRVVAPAEVFPVGAPMAMPTMLPNLMEARQAAAEAYLESTASKLAVAAGKGSRSTSQARMPMPRPRQRSRKARHDAAPSMSLLSPVTAQPRARASAERWPGNDPTSRRRRPLPSGSRRSVSW